MTPHPTLKATFANRAQTASHPLNTHLFKLMDLKASNLCLSADVASARELLYLADKIGPSIVVLKTHHDMVVGWDYHPQTGTGAKLASLARKHGFLIFEDRKFGDIGNTVELQYTAGSARIIEWAHIVNVNMVPGKASVTTLAKAAARWLERYPYEVKTSITIGTPTADQFDESEPSSDVERDDDRAIPELARGENGRKGSIVSTTTVTQQYEPADSPRLVKTIAEGDETVFPGIEEAPIERGLLILAQMSTEGNFMNKEYTQACVEAARENKDFVMGFISQESLNSQPDDDFIHMTPGCQLPPEGEDENAAVAGDGKGQQYNTPQKIVGIAGCDIVIVGRGIIKAGDPQGEAERYRSLAWKAYSERYETMDFEIDDEEDGLDMYSASRNGEEPRQERVCFSVAPYVRWKSPRPSSARDHHEHHDDSDSERGRGSPTCATPEEETYRHIVNKEAACTYETGAPTAQQKKASPSSQPNDSPEDEGAEALSSMAADWGYAQNGASTMGFLKKIETADGRAAPGNQSVQAPREDDYLIKEKYKGLIRQLPAKIYIDKLIDMYMHGLNWQYYPVDPDIFYQQLEEWNNLPFQTLSTIGPQGLSPDLRAFPALLFHIIATALLLLPGGPDPVFDALKYAGNMKFEDLAIDYSESGAAIVELLGKKRLSLVTVQAQFLRASFLKYTAKVTEAWHNISVAIRDAQELGMHRDRLDPKPKDDSIESVLENQWLIQRRRKMYILLAVWDLNCALVLGRPGTVDWNKTLPTPPIDAPIPQDRSKTPVIPRDEEKDHPTPLTRTLWNLQLCGPLRAIQNLELEEGVCPKDSSKIDKIHQDIMELDERVPPAFRLVNPDTQWDDRPDMHWIQANRYYFASLYQFSLMALHRPYVFNRKESRSEAIQASLRMLEIQRMTFHGLPPDSWRNFMLFYGSFDAIVLIASVYILFPHEHPELTGSVLQHFQWTTERFSAMQERNPLARSAQGVLRAIIARVKKAVSSVAPPSSTEGRSLGTPTSDGKATTAATESTPASSLSAGEPFAYPQPSTGNEWTVPSTDNLASIAPMFPTSDLIYNDLNAVHDNNVLMPPLGGEPTLDGGDFAWQFGGDLGDDSFWQLLNQFQPGVGGDGLG
ncbi:Fc.00g015280.m01.CDS01 [Cosmosporella sp. VM-42]